MLWGCLVNKHRRCPFARMPFLFLLERRSALFGMRGEIGIRLFLRSPELFVALDKFLTKHAQADK
jgi:hypothetical protein